MEDILVGKWKTLLMLATEKEKLVVDEGSLQAMKKKKKIKISMVMWLSCRKISMVKL